MAAGQVKTVSGQVTTYVITDAEGATCTVVLTNTYGAGKNCTITTSGNLHQDGQQLLVTLMQMISTGLTP